MNLNFIFILWIGVIPVLYILLIIVSKRKEKYRQICEQIAFKLHLDIDSDKILIQGHINTFPIVISEVNAENNKTYTEISLNYPVQGYGDWYIVKEGLPLSGLTSDIQIGDEEFDKRFVLRGDAYFLRSILNVRLRDLLYSMMDIPLELSIDENNITALFQQNSLSSLQKMDQMISKLVKIAQAVTSVDDMCERCIENALKDPSSQTRIYNLSILKDKYFSSKDAVQTLKKAMLDQDVDVQLHAAILLGKDGLPTLNAMLTSEQLDSSYLNKILGHYRARKFAGINTVLIECYRLRSQIEEKVEILNSMQHSQNDNGHDFILHILDGEKDKQILAAAFNALGECGILQDVEILYKMERSGQYSGLKNNISRAISRIQDRSGTKGDKGWLTLSELSETEGGLSLPQGDEGGLSMVEEK